MAIDLVISEAFIECGLEEVCVLESIEELCESLTGKTIKESLTPGSVLEEGKEIVSKTHTLFANHLGPNWSFKPADKRKPWYDAKLAEAVALFLKVDDAEASRILYEARGKNPKVFQMLEDPDNVDMGLAVFSTIISKFKADGKMVSVPKKIYKGIMNFLSMAGQSKFGSVPVVDPLTAKK